MELLQPFFLWFIDHFYLGYFIYIVIYAIFKACMIPISFLVLGISLVYGHAYGPLKGFFIAVPLILISADLGACLAFTVGRFLLKDYIRKYVISEIKMFKAVDLAIEHHGLKMATILRLTPIIPHNLYPYVMSVTTLSYKNLILGNTLGMLPMATVYVYFAVHFSNIDDVMNGPDLGPYSLVYVTLVSAFMILVILMVLTYTKEEFERLIAKDNLEKQL